MQSNREPSGVLNLIIQLVTQRDQTGGARISGEKGLFDELLRFQTLCERRGEPHVSKSAIRSWRKGATPKRLSALQFLNRFVDYKKSECIKNGAWSDELEQDFRNAESDIQGAIVQISHTTAKGFSEIRPNVNGDINPIHIALDSLSTASQNHTKGRLPLLFRGSSNHESDDSYYLLYRYSTNNGRILKSFLVIRSPQFASGTYQYSHFLWGGRKTKAISHIFRESSGVVLGFEKAFYLVGYDFTVPINREYSPDLYRLRRNEAKWEPSGLEMIALEYDDVKLNPQVHPALIMSVAALSQPIVARAALVHLGTRNTFGKNLSDNILHLGELSPSDLESDFSLTLSKMKDEGFTEFSDTISILTSSDQEKKFSDIVHRVLKFIDNKPAWSALSEAGREEIFNGAIETCGSGRPRD